MNDFAARPLRVTARYYHFFVRRERFARWDLYSRHSGRMHPGRLFSSDVAEGVLLAQLQ